MDESGADLKKLKGNRRAYKAALKRVQASTESAIANYSNEDPTGLELAIHDWNEALQQFRDSDFQILSHEDADPADADQDIADLENAFRNATTKTIAIRGDFDKAKALYSESQTEFFDNGRVDDREGNIGGRQGQQNTIESEYVYQLGKYIYIL